MTSNWLVMRFAGLLVAALFVALWKAIAVAKLVSPAFLPDPFAAWSALIDGFGQYELLPRLLLTLEHIFLGWLVASLCGIGAGSLVGVSQAARIYVAPMFEIFRPLPAAALFPVAIAIFGLNETMVIFVIAFGAVWPTVLATVHGFETVNQRLIDVRKMLTMSRWHYVWKIALPNASSQILAGMRLSLTYSLVLSVTGEMLSSSDGLGFWIMQQSRAYRADSLFAGVILFGCIGYLTSRLMTVLERRLLRWREVGNAALMTPSRP